MELRTPAQGHVARAHADGSRLHDPNSLNMSTAGQLVPIAADGCLATTHAFINLRMPEPKLPATTGSGFLV